MIPLRVTVSDGFDRRRLDPDAHLTGSGVWLRQFDDMQDAGSAWLIETYCVHECLRLGRVPFP
jgi:hypothetical protein